MLDEQTLEKLYAMKLNGMAEAFKEQLQQPDISELSFEERVDAQAAIERIYYSHQLGTTKAFEEAVPRHVLEEKVRRYLQQSVALEKFWETPITAEMLRREMERMAQGTRMPERLAEIYNALFPPRRSRPALE